MELSFNKMEKQPIDVWTRVTGIAKKKINDPASNLDEELKNKVLSLLNDPDFKKDRKPKWIPVIDNPEKQEEVWADGLISEAKNWEHPIN